MTTAVDTNVLVDVLRGDPRFGPGSAAALHQALNQGRLVACEVVWAELAGLFPQGQRAADILRQAGVDFSPMDEPAANLAGERWSGYRRGGGPRSRVIADFMIGAHALLQADCLLTRDRGYFATHFPDLGLIDPRACR